MKSLILFLLTLGICCPAFAREDGRLAGGAAAGADTLRSNTIPAEKPKKKIFRGVEGGVLFNTGWAFVNLPIAAPDGPYSGGGVPLGVSGRGLVLLGDHFRVGGEGYMNTFKIDDLGSESRFAYGGAMGDFYWKFGRVMPYAGCSIGAGFLSNFKTTAKPGDKWEKVESYFNNTFIWAACPYVGVQIKVSKKISIIAQVGYTTPLNSNIYREFNCLNTCIGLEFGN